MACVPLQANKSSPGVVERPGASVSVRRRKFDATLDCLHFVPSWCSRGAVVDRERRSAAQV